MTASIIAILGTLFAAGFPYFLKWIALKFTQANQATTIETHREQRVEQDILRDQGASGPALCTSAHAAGDLDELDRLERMHAARANTQGPRE